MLPGQRGTGVVWPLPVGPVGRRALGVAARRAVRSNKVAWLAGETLSIARDLRRGSTKSLWALARRAARRTPSRAAGVLRLPDGKPLTTPDECNAAWERKFLDEFAGRGDIVTQEVATSRIAAHAAATQPLDVADLPSQVDLAAQLADALHRARRGRQVGEELAL